MTTVDERCKRMANLILAICFCLLGASWFYYGLGVMLLCTAGYFFVFLLVSAWLAKKALDQEKVDDTHQEDS